LNLKLSKNPYFLFFYDIWLTFETVSMGMNKNTVLAWATWIMIFVGLGMIALGAFKYDEVAGYGFGAVGIGFFAIAWVFNALKGRV